jgi:MtaA/CmuA family methyltransferase
MTGRERVEAKMAGRATDSLPLMPITMMFAGDLAGIRYREYASDHRKLVEAQLKTAETYDFDYVSVISDPAREASDLGGTVEWFDDQPPAIVESRALLEEKGRLRSLRVGLGERMMDRVEGVRKLAEAVGREKVVEGWVEGPCALGADLRGVNTLMLDFHDDPEFVTALFEYVTALETEFAKAQVEAGARLMGVGDAAASLIGPKLYERFVLPYECRLVRAIRAMGAAVRLHICGSTRKILRGMGRVGAEIVDLDFLAPMQEGRAAMGPEQVLLGNIDPVRVLRDSTPGGIERALEECRAAAAPRWICGAGCEVPRGTPHENMMAMTRFARGRS